MKRNPVAYWRRYLRFLVKYGSARKLANLFSLWYFYYRNIEVIPTRPAFLKVEVSRYCDVNCRYCEKSKDNRMYPLPLYRQLIAELRDYILAVSLYDIGKPLHNPELLECIRYAHGQGVGTVVSTSLSVEKPEDYWRDLVHSGLDRLIVAIDGVTEGVYKMYRRHGNFDLVMSNLRTILRLRASHKNDLLVEWQMLDLPWNEHEQAEARSLAKTTGVDAFVLKREENTVRLKYREMGVIRRRNCLLPYIVFIVDAYNRARPCYKLYSEDVFIGDLRREGFAGIWNGEEIRRIRSKSKICKRSPCMTCRE